MVYMYMECARHDAVCCLSETLVVHKEEDKKDGERRWESDPCYDVNGLRHSDWMRWFSLSHLHNGRLWVISYY